MIDPNTHLPVQKQYTPNPNRIVPRQLNKNVNPQQAYTLPDEYASYDFNFAPGMDMNEIRAQNQDYLFPKALGRLATGAMFEMAKVVPYLGGSVMSLGAAIAGQDNPISYMVDNALLRGINAAQEHFNEEIMPIYQTNAAANGSLFDRLFEPSFWATQGADAGAFFLSMIIPGRLAASAGLGAKIQEGLAAAGRSTRVLKPTFQTSAKAGKVMDDISATLINTASESAAEASHFYTDVRDQLIASGMSEEEAAQIAGANASAVFGMNMGLLAASNFVFDAMVFKSFNNVFGLGNKAAYSQVVDEAGKIIDTPIKSSWFKRGAVGLAAGTMTEGFYEEGFQFATEEYYKKRALDLEREDNVWDTYWTEIADNADMHVGIFLGSILGGGAGAISTARAGIENVRNIEGRADESGMTAKLKRRLGMRPKKAHEGLRTLAASNLVNLMRSVDEVFVKDENGKTVMEDDNGVQRPKIDSAKLQAMSAEQQGMIMHLAELRRNLLDGDEISYNHNKTFIDFNAMLPYFQTPGGMEALKKHLELRAQQEVEAVLQQNPDSQLDAKKLAEQAIADAQAYKKIYDRIEDTHHKNFRVKGKDKSKTQVFDKLVRGNKLTTALHEHAISRSISQLKEELKQYSEDTADGEASIKAIETTIEKLEKEKEKITKHGKRLYNNKEVQKMYDTYLSNEAAHKQYTSNDVFESPDGKIFTLVKKTSDALGQEMTYHLQSLNDPNETRSLRSMDGYTHYGNTSEEIDSKVPVRELSEEEFNTLLEEFKPALERGDPDAIAEFLNTRVAGTDFRLPNELRQQVRELLEERLSEFETPQEMYAFADRLFDKTKNPKARNEIDKMINARIRIFKAIRDQEIGGLNRVIKAKKTSIKDVNKSVASLSREIAQLTSTLMTEATNLKASLVALKQAPEFRSVDKRSDPGYRAAKKALIDKYNNLVELSEARIKDLSNKRESYKKLASQLESELETTEKFKKWLASRDKLLSMSGFLDKMRADHHVLVSRQQQLIHEIQGRIAPLQKRDLYSKSQFEQVIKDYRQVVEDADELIKSAEEVLAADKKEFDRLVDAYLANEDVTEQDIEQAEEKIKEVEDIIKSLREVNRGAPMKQVQKFSKGLKNTQRIANFENNIEALSQLMDELQSEVRSRKKAPLTPNAETPLVPDTNSAPWSLKRTYETLFSGLVGAHYTRDGNLTTVESQQRYFKFTQINNVTDFHVRFVLESEFPELFSQQEREQLASVEDREIREAPIVIAVVIDPNTGKPVDMHGKTHDKISPTKSIYTTVPVPTTNLSSYENRIFKPAGVTDEAHKINLSNQIKYYTQVRDTILEKLKVNEVVTIPIGGKSRGIPIKDQVDPKDPTTIKNKRFSDIGIDIFNASVTIPTSDTTTIDGVTITGLKGKVFVSGPNNNVHYGYIRRMNQREQDTVIELFKLMAQGATPQDLVPNTKTTIFEALNSFMYYGANAKQNTPISDFIDGSGVRFLDIGTDKIILKVEDDGSLYKEELIRVALSERYANIRSKVLNNKSATGAYETVRHDGTSFHPLTFNNRGTVADNYLEYLAEPEVEGELPILSTYAPIVSDTDVTQNQFKTQYLILDYSLVTDQYGIKPPVRIKKPTTSQRAPISVSKEVETVVNKTISTFSKYYKSNYVASESAETFFDPSDTTESVAVVIRNQETNRVGSFIKDVQDNGEVIYKPITYDTSGNPVVGQGQMQPLKLEEVINSPNSTFVTYIHRTDEAPAAPTGSSVSSGWLEDEDDNSSTPPSPTPPPAAATNSGVSSGWLQDEDDDSSTPPAPTPTATATASNTVSSGWLTEEEEDDDQSPVNKARARKKSNKRNFKPRLPDGTAEVENIEEGLKWFKSQFPNIPVAVTRRLIENQAWGAFTRAGVKVYSKAGVGTFFHEGFHVVFNLYMTPRERANLISKYKEAKGIEADDLTVEEMIADDFMDYMLTGSLSDISIREQRSFFRRLLDFLRSLFLGKTLTEQYKIASLAQLFDVIGHQPFNAAPKYSYDGTNKYRSIEGLELTEINDALDVAQWEFFQALMDESDGSSLMQSLLSGGKIANEEVIRKFLNVDPSGNDFISEMASWFHPDDRADFPFEGVPDKVLDNSFRIFTHLHNYRNEFRELFLERMKKLDLNIEAEAIVELEENESEAVGYSQDTAYDVASIEISGKKSASTTLRKFLSTLSNTIDADTFRPGPLGWPTNINFNRAYSMLANKLANEDNLESMLQKLLTLNPEMQSIHSQIKRRTNEEEGPTTVAEDWITKLQFFQAFSKQRINYYLTILDDELGYKTIDSSKDYATKKIKNTWQENAVRTGALKPNDQGELVFQTSNLMPTLDKFLSTTLTTERKKLAISALRSVGIEMTAFLDEKGRPTNLEAMSNETISRADHLIRLIHKGLTTGGKAGVTNIYAESGNNADNIKHFLDIELETALDFFENQHINTDKKTVFDISLNHYMSILTNKINRAESFEQLLEELPFLGDSYLTNSILKQRMFKMDGSRIPLKMSIHDGLKTNMGNISKPFKRLNKAEKFYMWFNDTLEGRYHMHRAADNALERVLEIDGPLFTNPLRDGKPSPEVLDAMVGYLADELSASKSDYWGNFTNKTTPETGEAPLFLFDFLKNNEVAYAQVVSAFDQLKSGPIDLKGLVNTPEIKSAISDFLLEKIDEGFSLVNQYGMIKMLPNGNAINVGITGAEMGSLTELTSQELAEVISRFAINDVVMSIEQTKWFTGHPAFYKNVAEFYKRMSAMVGTKKLIETSPATNAFIKTLERTDERHLVQQTTPTVNVYVVKDIAGTSINDSLPEAYTDPDNNYDEADAQGFISIDEYREFLFRTGDWTPEMELVYLHEAGYTEIPDNTMFRSLIPGDTINTNKFGQDKYVFPPLKPQYFGPSVTGNNDFVPTMFKLSLIPLTKSLTKDRGLAKVAEQMKKHQVGIVMFNSANKVGTKKRADGSSPSLYKDNGDGTASVADFDTDVIQESRYDFWGIQVDNAAKRKALTPMGSQQLKQHKSDLYSNGAPRTKFNANKYTYDSNSNEFTITAYNPSEAAEYLDGEFNKLLDTRTRIGVQLLRNKLGITPDGNIDSYDKVAQAIRDEAIARDMPQNIIDSIDLMAKDLRFNTELSVAKEKIENVLMSMAESMTVKKKRRGAGFVQASSAGFETTNRIIGENGEIYSEHDLKFYKNEKGEVTSMEVYLPSIYKKSSGEYFTNDELNTMIAEGTMDLRLLEAVGFRIPTQGLSSIEHIRIKGFLPAHAGDVIVMPPEIVVKNGSDFDFDKMTTLLPNYYTDKNGKLKYIEYVEEESSFDDLFRRRKKSIISDYNLKKGALRRQFEALGKYNALIGKFVEEEAAAIGQLKTGQDLNLKITGGLLAEAEAELRYVTAQLDDLEAIQDSLTDEEYDAIVAEYEANDWTERREDFLRDQIDTLSTRLENLKDDKYVRSLKTEINKKIDSIIADKNKAFHVLNDIKREIDQEARALFDSLSLPEKNGMEAIENRMNELEKEIILAPSNHKLLVAPLDGGEVKTEARYIEWIMSGSTLEFEEWLNTVKKEEAQPYSDLLSLTKTADVNDQFLNANAGVGISALQQTNHILAQRHNLFIRPQFTNRKGDTIETKISGLPHHSDADGNIYLSHRENTVGDNISYLLSQMTSAYVDAAKDPFVFYLNAGTETAGIYMYLMRAGVPLRELTLFMNQPIIKEFLSDRAIYESIYYDRANAGGSTAVRGRDAIAAVTARKFGTAVATSVDYSPQAMERAIRDRDNLTPDQMAQQQVYLNDFIRYMETARALSDAITATTYDTRGFGKNMNSLILQLKNTIEVTRTNAVGNFKDLFESENAFLKPYYDSAREVFNQFGHYSLAMSKPEVLDDMIHLTKTMMEAGKTNDQILKVLDRYQTELVTYALHQHPEINEARFQELFFGDNSLPRQLIALKRNMKYELNPNKLVMALEGIIPRLPDRLGNPRSQSIAMKTAAKIDTDEADEYTAEWTRLFTTHPKFANDLVDFVIMQSGITNSPINFMKFVPADVYHARILKLFPSPEAMQDFDVSGMYDKFFLNNVVDNDIVPHNKFNKAHAKLAPYSKITDIQKDPVTKKTLDRSIEVFNASNQRVRPMGEEDMRVKRGYKNYYSPAPQNPTYVRSATDLILFLDQLDRDESNLGVQRSQPINMTTLTIGGVQDTLELVDNSTLVDGDVVYNRDNNKFIYRGVRPEGKIGAGSPRLERTDGSGEIAIPGVNVKLYKKVQQRSQDDFNIGDSDSIVVFTRDNNFARAVVEDKNLPYIVSPTTSEFNNFLVKNNSTKPFVVKDGSLSISDMQSVNAVIDEINKNC